MILFIFYTSILYVFISRIEPNQTNVELPFLYGFEEGGKYSIEITNCSNEKYLIYIEKKLKLLPYLSSNSICTNSTLNVFDTLHIIQAQNGKYNVSGSIKQKEIYKTIIRSCNNSNKGFTVKITFLNPNSPYSYDIAKILKYDSNFLIIYIFLFLLWICNWFLHFSLNNQLHNLITFYYLFFLLAKLISHNDFKKRNESNQFQFSKTKICLSILRNFIYFTTMFLVFNCFDIIKRAKKNAICITILIWCCIFAIIFYIFYSDRSYLLFFVILFSFPITCAVSTVCSEELYDESKQNYFVFYNQLFYISNGVLYISIYILPDLPDLPDFKDIELLVFETSFLIINCIYGILMRMRVNTKNDYTEIFKEYNDIIINENPITYECQKRNLIIPNNISCINKYTYCYNNWIENVEFEEKSILTTIQSFSFQYSSIKSIKIPPSVKIIKENAFSHCQNLESITFIEKSRILELQDIINGSSIKSINIPSSVIKIHDKWCSNVKELIDIYVSPINHNYLYHENNFILGKSNSNCFVFDLLIFARRNIRYITIPLYITRICSYCFKYCKNIINIKFQENSKLFIIDENSFSESSISKIRIPKNVSYIETSAFLRCVKLKIVEFEENSNLLKIGDYAFSDSYIENIIIPFNVFDIGKNAFAKCSKLNRIIILDNSNLRIINSNAFDNTSITSFTITSNVNFIGKNAFANCKNLKIVEFNDIHNLCYIDIEIFQNSSQVIILVPAQMMGKCINFK